MLTGNHIAVADKHNILTGNFILSFNRLGTALHLPNIINHHYFSKILEVRICRSLMSFEVV